MVKKQIYSPWAFTKDQEEKRNTNYEIYKEFKAKYKISYVTEIYDSEKHCFVPINQGDFDIIIKHSGTRYAHAKYSIIKNSPNLSVDELALICDSGNLCFGYRGNKAEIIVYTD